MCGSSTDPAAERLEAFRHVMGTLRLPVVPEYIVTGDHAWSAASAGRAVRALLELPRGRRRSWPVATRSPSARLRELRAIGRDVPGDVALVGFDDPLDGDLLDPPMTALGRHYRDLGEIAAGVLLDAPAQRPGRRPSGDPGAARVGRAQLLRLLSRLTNRRLYEIHCSGSGIDCKSFGRRDCDPADRHRRDRPRLDGTRAQLVLPPCGSEHFPDLGLTPRLVVASDLSASRRAHAERIGFGRHRGGLARRARGPRRRPRGASPSPTRCTARSRSPSPRRASTCGSRSPWAAARPTPRRSYDAVQRAGVLNGVGFCYRFAPAVAHAQALIAGGGDRRRDALPRRVPRELRQPTRLGRLVAVLPRRRGLRRARRSDGPRRRLHPLSGRPDRPASFSGRYGDDHRTPPARSRWEREHTSRASRPTTWSRWRTRTGPGAQVEFAGGTIGSIEASEKSSARASDSASRSTGSRGSLRWELERMNELQRYTLRDDGGDEGYTTVFAEPRHPRLRALPARRRRPDELRRPARARGREPARRRSATASSARPASPRWSRPRTCSTRSSARPRPVIGSGARVPEMAR